MSAAAAEATAVVPVERRPSARSTGRRRAAQCPLLKVVSVGAAGAGTAVAAGRAVLLDRAVCVVGARSTVHLPLPSPLVSRTHALVVTDRADGVVYVRDLASRNHVYRNGEPVREATLAPADLLRIGPVAFACAAGFDVPPAAPTGGAPDVSSAELVAGSGALRYPIYGRTLLLGRRPECDVAIDDVAVSSVHAVVFRRDGRHYVRDLNSAYGVMVNGTKVREVELRPGDDLRVGPVRFRYETAADRLSADDLVALDDADAPSASNAGLASRHDLGGQTVTTGFGPAAPGGEKLNGMATLGEIPAGDHDAAHDHASGNSPDPVPGLARPFVRNGHRPRPLAIHPTTAPLVRPPVWTPPPTDESAVPVSPEDLFAPDPEFAWPESADEVTPPAAHAVPTPPTAVPPPQPAPALALPSPAAKPSGWRRLFGGLFGGGRK